MSSNNNVFLIDDKYLSGVVGGKEVVSSDTRLRNILSFYANLVPFVSTKHIKITYNIGDWTGEGNERTRTITQKAIKSDMKWSNLSKSEKLGVSVPVIGVGMVGAVGIGSFLARGVIKPYLDKISK